MRLPLWPFDCLKSAHRTRLSVYGRVWRILVCLPDSKISKTTFFYKSVSKKVESSENKLV